MESPTGLETAGHSSTITKCPSLPAEIWQLIFSVGWFDLHGGFWSTYDHPTMASICRCCTLFRDLIRPRLYCNFDSQLWLDEALDWQCFSVAKFARTISTNPSLASLVRRVDIWGACNMCDVIPDPPVTLTDKTGHPVASVLIKRAAEIGMDFQYYETYTNNDNGISGFDLVDLVLVQLPLMHTLHLQWLGDHTMSSAPQPRDGWPWAQSSMLILWPEAVFFED